MEILWELVWAIAWAMGGGLLGAFAGLIFGPANGAVVADFVTAISEAIFGITFWAVFWILGCLVLSPEMGSTGVGMSSSIVIAIIAGAISGSIFSSTSKGIPGVVFGAIYGAVVGAGVHSLMLVLPVVDSSELVRPTFLNAIAAAIEYAWYGACLGASGAIAKRVIGLSSTAIRQSTTGSMAGAMWSAIFGAILGTAGGALIGITVGILFTPIEACAIAVVTVFLLSIVLWWLRIDALTPGNSYKDSGHFKS